MKLSEYLTLTGMTATEFAVKADVAVSTITRAINGERRPEWKTLGKIQKATEGKVLPNDFVEEQGAA